MSVIGQELLLPLDAAADARDLIFIHRFTGENGVNSDAEILAGHGNVIARAAAVQLATVDEFLSAIEQEEIGRAGGGVGSGDGLRFVVTVGEREAESVGLFPKTFRGIGWVGGSVVGRDGDDTHGLCRVVVADFGQFSLYMLYVGAMAADEHHQKCLFAGVIGELDGLSRDNAGQFEGGCRRSQREHGGFGVCHRSTLKARITVMDEIPGQWLERAVVVVAAHPDDEVIGLGALLPRFEDLRAIVHVTDGAPKAGVEQWHEYAQLRRREFQAAMVEAGVGGVRQICLQCPDQEASFRMVEIARELCGVFEELRPKFVLTHPYEGGHPDHDATAATVQGAAELLRNKGPYAPTILEFSSYHQGPHGMETGCFLSWPEWAVNGHVLTEEEKSTKKKLFDCYVSQRNVLQYFPIGEEPLRPAPAYDFTQPPHEGKLYYENFQWGVTGEEWRELAARALRELKLAER